MCCNRNVKDTSFGGNTVTMQFTKKEQIMERGANCVYMGTVVQQVCFLLLADLDGKPS